MTRLTIAITLLIASMSAQVREAKILDLTHMSSVLGEDRNYRVFLPPDYDTSGKRYPVIYFFHGWSERHNKPPRGGIGYDSGDGYGGDNIARFVGNHDVIVVKWDGYNPRTPGEDYPRPYNVTPVETHRQFPLYFPELVKHIDATLRTIPDREHRATAGLSMGGFTSFWVAGKYPHLVGSASNFMGSAEFDVGLKEFPSEYRHTEMYRNYEGMRTRIVVGTKDFIRWYHQRMHTVWNYVRAHHEQESFEFDHGTPGMAKTLSFHMNAFANPLPKPKLWHHHDVYPEFDVWGYGIKTDRRQPGFTSLENVTPSGFRTSVREWIPSGRLLSNVKVQIITDAVYEPNRSYQVTDVDLVSGKVQRNRVRADSQGRLRLTADGSLHEFGIAAESKPIVTVASWKIQGASWVVAGRQNRLQLSFVNKGNARSSEMPVSVTSPNPDIHIESVDMKAPKLAPGEVRDGEGSISLRIDAPNREIVQLKVTIGDTEIPLEIPAFADVPEIQDVLIADGSTHPVWERAVHQAVKAVGEGNGNNKAQAGEKIVLGVRDGEAYRLVEVLAAGACADLSSRVSDPWARYDNVGATAKYTQVRLDKSCPVGTRIPLFVRYQLPNKPEHILKEGVVYLTLGEN